MIDFCPKGRTTIDKEKLNGAHILMGQHDKAVKAIFKLLELLNTDVVTLTEDRMLEAFSV